MIKSFGNYISSFYPSFYNNNYYSLLISCYGYGSIYFLNNSSSLLLKDKENDIKLGENVIISSYFVEIESKSLKNLSAIIILENIYTKNIKKLKNILKRQGALFLDYSFSKGIIRFYVPHFSKYDLSAALLDDDDDDSDDIDDSSMNNSIPSTSIKNFSISNDSPSSFIEESTISDNSDNDSDDMEVIPPSSTGLYSFLDHSDNELSSENEEEDEDDEDDYNYPPNSSITLIESTESESESDMDYIQSTPMLTYMAPIDSNTLPVFQSNSFVMDEDSDDNEEDFDNNNNTESQDDMDSSDNNINTPFKQIDPKLDIGKAQVMKNVFFPFPHKGTDDNNNSNDTITSNNDNERIIGDVDEFSSLENNDYINNVSIKTETPKTFASPFMSPFTSQRFSTPKQEKDVEPIFFTPKDNTIFPEEISFPPKKRFAGVSDIDSNNNSFGNTNDKPIVEIDPLFTRSRVPINESIISNEIKDIPKDNTDISLSMGRSFRVGWGPRGILAYQSKSSLVGSIIIDNVSTVASGKNPETERIIQYEPLLRVHYNNNKYNDLTDEYSFMPNISNDILYDLNMDDDDDDDNNNNNENNNHSTVIHTINELIVTTNDRINEFNNELEIHNNNIEYQNALELAKQSHKVWKLIYSLYSNESFLYKNTSNYQNIISEINLYDSQEKQVMLECRKALSQWGQEALNDSILYIHEKLENIKSSTYFQEAIINLLTGRQLKKAINMAIENNEFRLATLISQPCNIIMRESMNAQVNNWQELLQNNSIEPILGKLYKLLGGDIDNSFISRDSDDWLRLFFLYFWYGEYSNTEPYIQKTLDSFMNSSLTCFNNDNNNGIKPVYSYDASVYDILYQIICYFCKGDINIWDLVEPESYSIFKMEYSTSWLVFTLLSSLINQPFHTQQTLNENEYEFYKNKYYQLSISFANQLEMVGLFHWGIYVLQHLPDKNLRNTAIQKLLNRNFIKQSDDWLYNTNNKDSNLDNIANFLTNDLHIPIEMIYIAKSYACGYTNNHIDQLANLIHAKQRDEAHSLFVEKVAPYSVLQFHEESKSFLQSQYANIPELLKDLVSLMDNGEGAYKIYNIYYDSILNNSNPDLLQLIDHIKSRLSELNKYSSTPKRLQLERVILSNIPSGITNYISNDIGFKDIALGAHQQPMPSGNQFAFFDSITNNQLYSL